MNSPIARFTLLLGGLALALGFVTLPPPAQQPPPQTSEKDKGAGATSFDVLDPQIPLVVPIPSDLKGHAVVTVTNTGGPAIENMALFVALKDDSGKVFSKNDVEVVLSPPHVKLEPNIPLALQIVLTLAKPLPKFEEKSRYASQSLSGYLFFKVGNTVKQKPLQLVPFQSSPQAAWLIWIGFGTAVLIGAICLWRLKSKLGERMVFPEWTTSSWVTNLTIAGTVLTATTSAAGVVKQPHTLQAAEYTTLAVLFGALVMIAPLAYNSGRFAQTPDSGGVSTPKYEGYVWVFIVAITFTLWGAFGQFLLVYYYFSEFANARLISRSGSWVFHGGIALVGLLLCFYVARTIHSYATQSEAIQPSSGSESKPVGVTETPASEPKAGLVTETPPSDPKVGVVKETLAPEPSAAAVKETPGFDQEKAKQRLSLL